MITIGSPSSTTDHLPKHVHHHTAASSRIPIVNSLQSAKVILKAKQSFKADHIDQLSFSPGEQFILVKPSPNPDFVLVLNPSTRAQGLVPVKYFEMLIQKDQSKPTTTHSSPSSPSSTTNLGGPLNLAAKVKFDIFTMSETDLPAKSGDLILLLSDHEDYYLAKHINKLGNPGRVLKSMVELIDAVPSNKCFPPPITKQKSNSYIETLVENTNRNYKKYYSEADITKSRSRHTPSSTSNSSISTTSTSSTSSTLVGGELSILSIKPSKAIPHRNQYYLVEYKVYLSDSTKKVIYRKLNELPEIHKELKTMLNMDLPPLPFDISPFHPVNGPFLTDTDLKVIYQYFKQLAVLLPNSGVFALPPILNFAKLTDSNMHVKTINIEHPFLLSKFPSKMDDDLPPPPTIPLPPTKPIEPTFTSSIKVKYQYKADLMAFILEPAEINYDCLYSKLTQRIKGDFEVIHYQDNRSGTVKELRSQKDLLHALDINSGNKVFLIVS